MSSRPKVLTSTPPPNASTPPTRTLRPKASLSSVAKIRRAPSPNPSSSGSPTIVNASIRVPTVPNAARRPLSSQGRPVTALSPVARDGFAPHSSPVSPTFPRERQPSVSRSVVSPPTTGPVRVKAKVSSLAKPQPAQPHPTSIPPPTLQHRASFHTRSNSIHAISVRPPLPVSSQHKSPPASPRRPNPPVVHTFPPTPVKSDDVPHSPPSSILSSQSSISVDSNRGSISRSHPRVLSKSFDEDEDSLTRTGNTPVPAHPPAHGNGYFTSPTSFSPRDDGNSDLGSVTSPTHERKSSLGMTEEEAEMRAEARTNRKIADLEIQTTSLQQLTASLERDRHKQSLEIRDLRRKLRESRLALPPRTFQSLKATWGANPLEFEDDDDDDDEDAEDPTWDRVKGLVNDLLNVGRRAVEEGKEFMDRSSKQGGGVVRVLTAGELEELENIKEAPESDEEQEGEDDRDGAAMHIGTPVPHSPLSLFEDEQKHLDLDEWPS